MSKQHQSSSSSKPNSNLFKIPFFPPLLDSYDVPAPIIIPPGSDPCLLNPNTYDDQVLKTTPSLMLMDTDIDPCVVAASRSESVTKRVDLTAYEHAGVSLIEPTANVSTACHDLPLNSEAVAPQTVNYVTCNTEKSFKKHMEENIHLNNTKNLTGSSTVNQETEKKKKKNLDLENINPIVSTVTEQEKPLSVANGTLDEDSEKKKQNEAAGKSLVTCQYPKSLFVCDIPEPGRAYPKIATVEVDESLLKNPTLVQPSNSGTKDTKLNIVHQTPQRTTLITSSCELCGVHCPSHDMLKHILGKKHQKKLKKTGQQSVSSPAPVPKTQLLEPMNEEGEKVFWDASKRKANDSLSSEEDADTKRQKMSEEEEACGVLVVCKVCNVGFDGLMAFKTHIASFEHSAMLLKQSKGGSKGLQV